MKRSTLAASVAAYLQYRTQLGFKLENEHSALPALVRFARHQHHRGPLTTRLAVAWACASPQASPCQQARRLDMARTFARFWQPFDPRTEIPPPGLLGSSYPGRPPAYIYTDQQIRDLLAATAQLRPAWRAITFKTFFGLLAVTGLRLSEALHLQTQDLDWGAGLLTIRRAKFKRTRQIPVHASTLQALQRYQRQRVRVGQCPAFFLQPNGQPLSLWQVKRAFQRLRRQLGWTAPPRRRLHDLRHTFAVNTLLRWYRHRRNVGRQVLGLTHYLGHRRLTDTYWYLSAVPALLALARQRWERRAIAL
jgi:integrase